MYSDHSGTTNSKHADLVFTRPAPVEYILQYSSEPGAEVKFIPAKIIEE